jgi:hypothetical protein
VRRILVPALLVALAFPAAAEARKNAWQLSSLSGTYSAVNMNSPPATCSSGTVVLTSHYDVSWRATSFGKGQYAAKYFPVFRGPQTNGAGQRATIVGGAIIRESYATFTDQGDGTCTRVDGSCTGTKTIKESRTPFLVSHSGFTDPPQIRWAIDFGGELPDCAPDQDATPVNGLGLFKSKATLRQFARRRSSFSIAGRSGRISYSARAKLKKVVIPDGCRDSKPQRLFVCSP